MSRPTPPQRPHPQADARGILNGGKRQVGGPPSVAPETNSGPNKKKGGGQGDPPRPSQACHTLKEVGQAKGRGVTTTAPDLVRSPQPEATPGCGKGRAYRTIISG